MVEKDGENPPPPAAPGGMTKGSGKGGKGGKGGATK